MSEHKFFCPSCGQKISCDTGDVGRTISCPVCQTAFSIPAPVMAQIVAAPSAPPLPPPPPAPVYTPPTPVNVPTAAAAPVYQPPPARPPQAPVAPARPARYGEVVQHGKNYCGLAKASLISSVVLGIGWLPGIILGHMARNRIRRNPLLDGNGLAMSGLLISYATLFIMLCLGAGAALYGHARVPEVVVRNSLAQQGDLARRMVDEVVVADVPSERAHGIAQQTANTRKPTGYDGTNKWRGAQGRDAFAYTMDVLPDQPMILNCRFSDDPNQRLFDVIVDSEPVGGEVFKYNVPGHFYDVEYKLPAELTHGKKEINVVFRSQSAPVMGRLYACQTLKP